VDFDQHVDMIAREHAADDGDAYFCTDLLDDRSDPVAYFAMEHLEPIFGCPDNVVTVVKIE
jgi:hypothetical protein